MVVIVVGTVCVCTDHDRLPEPSLSNDVLAAPCVPGSFNVWLVAVDGACTFTTLASSATNCKRPARLSVAVLDICTTPSLAAELPLPT